MHKTALIAGASGLLGSHLLPLLLASDRYSKVIMVGRRPVPLVHPKLEQRILDFEQLEENAMRLIADDVYCCLGTTRRRAGSRQAFYRVDYLYVVTLAALTARNFAAQLLLASAVGANPSSRSYYNRVKGEMEEAVGQLPFRAIHIFRPALLLGERDDKRLGDQVRAGLLGMLQPLLIGPLRKYRAVPADTVARAMLQAAEDEGHGIRLHRAAKALELAVL